jgi:N utilization substance protein A
MDTKAFNEALTQLAESKGISKEAVIDALRESLEKAYIRYLGGGDDAKVQVEVDPNTGAITLAQIKAVVAEVEDDYLEISVEDANEGRKRAKYKVGDEYSIPCPIEDLTKLTAMAVKNILRQKIAEAERSALYEIYKDHIGEMITGTVEKADDRSVSVNIGRTTVELGRHEMIGDEYFKVGDTIKVYIQEVKSAHPEEEAKNGKKRGPQIEVTRSSEGFLKRLFEEEIHEIYDGTVVIKSIAREAGIRSKVAVYSNNEDVDATGACIGPGGTRIQKIVTQLGNGKDKEKIDIINYSTNPAVFIIEALRPASVIGVALTDPEATPSPKATAIIKDGQLSVAIGRRAANARLASRITGWSIDIKEESQAAELGIEYTSSEEWIAEAEKERREKEKEAFLAKARKAAEEAEVEAKKEEAPAPVAPTPAPAPVAPKAAVNPDEFPEEAANPAAAALAFAKEEEERKAAEAAKKAAAEEEAKKAAPVEPAEPTFVHTTTTLSDLEKELESAKEKKSKPVLKGRRPRKITEEEVKNTAAPASEESVTPAINAMPIYSEEEMEAIAKEEAEAAENAAYDDDIDYEDYDQYYDDDDGGRR